MFPTGYSACRLAAACSLIEPQSSRTGLDVGPKIKAVDVLATVMWVWKKPFSFRTFYIRITGDKLLVVAGLRDWVKQHSNRAWFLHRSPKQAMIEVCTIFWIWEQDGCCGALDWVWFLPLIKF